MSRFKIEWEDAIEVIEADYVYIIGDAVCFFIDNDIVAIRMLCVVTKHGTNVCIDGKEVLP